VSVSEVSGRQHLRSASRRKLNMQRFRGSAFGTLAFAVAGPTVWNSLLDSLRDLAVESERFRRDLKTHLFAGQ